jgi:elongation factor 1 alpha-like protein
LLLLADAAPKKPAPEPAAPKATSTAKISAGKPKLNIGGGSNKPKLNIGRPAGANASPSKNPLGSSSEIEKDMSKLSVAGENSPLKVSSSGEIKAPGSASKKTAPPKQMTEQKRAKTLKDLKEGKKDKVNISMVVIGHVDAGKSTLMGHLLLKMGFVSKSVIDKFVRSTCSHGRHLHLPGRISDDNM